MCAQRTWQSLARSIKTVAHFEGKRLLSKEWVELVFEREYELAKMENGGHCKGGMNGQMLYLSPHGRVIAWQSYDPEGKGNTLMELILKNE